MNPGVPALVLGVVLFIVGVAVGGSGLVLIFIGLPSIIWGVWRILRARGTGAKPPTQP